MGSSMGIFGIFYLLFMVGVVLFLAYIVTRFVGLKQMNTLKGRNITIVESMSLGLDKMLYLVKIGNQCFLISSSGKNINLVSQVESANITLNMEDGTTQQLIDMSGFTKYLDMFRKKTAKEDVPQQSQTTTFESVMEQTEKERASASDIDKNVDKIKELFSNIKSTDRGGVE